MHILRCKRRRRLTALLALGFWMAVGAALAQGPSFDCGKVEDGSIEALICKDKGLAALDRKLAAAYAAASKKAADEQPPTLKAEQRGWIKGRNESLREAQGKALIKWGYDSPEMTCAIPTGK